MPGKPCAPSRWFEREISMGLQLAIGFAVPVIALILVSGAVFAGFARLSAARKRRTSSPLPRSKPRLQRANSPQPSAKSTPQRARYANKPNASTSSSPASS
jgi:hypothetical protein